MQQSLQHKSNALDFLDLRRLTLTFTQVVQLRPANFTTADQIHMVNAGRMDRESTFDTNAIGNAANRKGFSNAAVTLGNHGTFESLQTFTVAFNNLDPYAHGITHVKLGSIAAQLLCFDGTDQFIHCFVPPSLIDVHDPVVHPNG